MAQLSIHRLYAPEPGGHVATTGLDFLLLVLLVILLSVAIWGHRPLPRPESSGDSSPIGASGALQG